MFCLIIQIFILVLNKNVYNPKASSRFKITFRFWRLCKFIYLKSFCINKNLKSKDKTIFTKDNTIFSTSKFQLLFSYCFVSTTKENREINVQDLQHKVLVKSCGTRQLTNQTTFFPKLIAFFTNLTSSFSFILL